MTGFLKDRQSHWSTACPPVASVWIAIMLSRPKSISTNLSARTKMMIPCQSAHLHSGRAFSSVLSLIDLIARWPHKYYPHLMYGVIFIMIFGTRASSVWVLVQLSACFQTFIKPRADKSTLMKNPVRKEKDQFNINKRHHMRTNVCVLWSRQASILLARIHHRLRPPVHTNTQLALKYNHPVIYGAGGGRHSAE